MNLRFFRKGWTKGRRGFADSRGAMAIEFAIVAPVFLMFVIGIIDFSRLFWIKSTMQFAVEQTARYAMVNPSVSLAALQTYAANESTVTGVTFNATTSAMSGVNFRTITANYTFSFLVPLIPMGDIILAARSSTPVNNL